MTVKEKSIFLFAIGGAILLLILTAAMLQE